MKTPGDHSFSFLTIVTRWLGSTKKLLFSIGNDKVTNSYHINNMSCKKKEEI